MKKKPEQQAILKKTKVKETKVLIKHKETVRLIGKENLRMDRPRLIACSLAINLLSLALPIITLQVYDRIIANGSQSTLNVLASAVVVAIVLESILRMTRSYVTGWAGAAFEHKISCEAVKHLLKADVDKVERQSAGEYLNRMASISKLREFYSGYALMTLIDLPFVGLFLGLIGYLAHALVAVPLIMLALFVAVAWHTSKSVKTSLARRDVKDETRYNFILEALQGIHTVKSGAYESQFMRKYEMLQARCTEANYEVAMESSRSFNYGYMFTSLMSCSIVVFGAVMATNGALTTGTLIACVLLSGRIMQPVQRAMALYSRYQDFELSKKHVDSLFHIPITTSEAPAYEYGKAGIADMDNVSFSYGHNQVLRSISLKLGRGDCISVSSDSSNGKSTMFKLLSGIYRPERGIVKIDGAEPCQYNSEELLKHIGYLPTQGVIYHGTVYENLTRFGKTKAADALQVSALLGIDREIAKLPNGYNTMLHGTTADNIPPGLKQRIAIARILAVKPSIILFDHADRALDKDGYNQVYRLLGKLKGRVTIVLISSDRNLLRLADREYILRDGTLIPGHFDPFEGTSNIDYRELA